MKNFGIIGAGIGLVVFLAVALLPAMLYGGYMGVVISATLNGGVAAGWWVKWVVIFWIALAVTGCAFLFMVTGGALGSVCGHLVGEWQSIKNEKARQP